MSISDDKKTQIWSHLLSLSHPRALTAKRFEKLKSLVWTDEAFWADLITRHSLTSQSPEQLRDTDKPTYDHAISNAWGMLMHIAIENKIVKP